MQEMKDLVSVIVPAYNAGAFINETIRSIQEQTYTKWELWVINDGSTDNTEPLVRAISESRIQLVNQENAGVSVARNTGLKLARGEFIVFFDADDIMTPDFLKVRVEALNRDSNIGFVGGVVESFPEKRALRKAVAENPEKDIHFFNANAATIPSNYLYRTAIIRDHQITFNPLLSSSADRFFLLELAKYSKGRALEDEKGKLLYRISESSMSHHVTPKLILDYYKFYNELNARNLLPERKRREIKSRYLFSIASSFSLIRHLGTCGKLLFRSFITHPLLFFKLATNKRSRNIN